MEKAKKTFQTSTTFGLPLGKLTNKGDIIKEKALKPHKSPKSSSRKHVEDEHADGPELSPLMKHRLNFRETLAKIPSMIFFDDGGFEYLEEDEYGVDMLTPPFEQEDEPIQQVTSSFIKKLAAFSDSSDDITPVEDRQEEERHKEKKHRRKHKKKQYRDDDDRRKSAKVGNPRLVMEDLGFGFQSALAGPATPESPTKSRPTIGEQLLKMDPYKAYEAKKSRENMSRISDGSTEPSSSTFSTAKMIEDLPKEGPGGEENSLRQSSSDFSKFALPKPREAPKRSLKLFIEKGNEHAVRMAHSVPGGAFNDFSIADSAFSSEFMAKSLDGEKQHKKKKKKKSSSSKTKSSKRSSRKSGIDLFQKQWEDFAKVNEGADNSPWTLNPFQESPSSPLPIEEERSATPPRSNRSDRSPTPPRMPVRIRSRQGSRSLRVASIRSIGSIKNKWDCYVSEGTSAKTEMLQLELARIKGMIEKRKNRGIEHLTRTLSPPVPKAPEQSSDSDFSDIDSSGEGVNKSGNTKAFRYPDAIGATEKSRKHHRSPKSERKKLHL
jgi:hypothetical protein